MVNTLSHNHEPLSERDTESLVDERPEARVSFTRRANLRLEYVANNMDLELMAHIQIETLLPVFHRRPLLHKLLLRFGYSTTLVARFRDPGIDVQYIEVDGRFLVLDVWSVGSTRGRPATCVIPLVELPWTHIPLYRTHDN